MAGSSKLQMPQPPQRGPFWLRLPVFSRRRRALGEIGKQSQKYSLTQFTSLDFEETQIHEMRMDFLAERPCVF